jgi:hypothetical protein
VKLSTHSRRITKIAAAALAVAAVAAPATQAANRPDDRPGMQGATPAVAVPDVFERAAVRGPVNQLGSRFDRPDNRPGTLGIGSVPSLDRPAASYYTPEALKADGARLQGQVAIYAGTTSNVAVPDVFERAVLRGPQGQPSIHPNDRPGVLGPGQISAEPSVSTGGSSFDWGDALVGGGVGLAIALLLTSAVAVGSYRRGVLKSA